MEGFIPNQKKRHPDLRDVIKLRSLQIVEGYNLTTALSNGLSVVP